jgi:hypothetical protein
VAFTREVEIKLSASGQHVATIAKPKADLGSATQPGIVATVLDDDIYGEVPVYSDGSSWRRVTDDRAVDSSYVLNVMDYGATGDGSTDDSSAFQDCFDAAEATLVGTDHGVAIEVPPGQYLLESQVQLDANNLFLFGYGLTSRLINGHSTDYCLRIGSGSTVRNHNRIVDLSFSHKTGVTPTAGGGLWLDKVANTVLERLHFHHFPNELWNGIFAGDSNALTIYRCRVVNSLNNGITLEDTQDCFLLDCYTGSVANDGFVFDTAEGVKTYNCHSYDAGRYGTLIKQAVGSPTFGGSRNQWHVGLINDTSGNHNLFADKLDRARFVSCWGATHSGAGNFDGMTFNSASPDDIRELSFVGCVTVNNNRHGLNLINTKRVVVSGHSAESNGKTVASSAGVRLNSGSGYVVGNCQLAERAGTPIQDFGILIEGGATDYIVQGCDTRGNSGADINDTANAADAIVRDNLNDGGVPNVVAAATITVQNKSDFITVSGTTQIDHINAKLYARLVTLQFTNAAPPTIGHAIGAPNIFLAGSVNLATLTQNSTLTLRCDGTDWHEVSRNIL